MRETLGFQVGDVVVDQDGYEARIVSIDVESFIAELDYDGFPSDVPPEATDIELDELELADPDAEAARAAEYQD